MKLITLTSDFEKQSQGIGQMEAVAYEICPEAKIIHLMHGIPDFSIITGARTMETVCFIPVGYHVCVVDPGVGTKRRGIVIETERGDYLIGPDNGVLVPAARLLGIRHIVQITNPAYLRHPVSPIFHGRDVFTPTAAHLACGISIDKFGPSLHAEDLVAAPYNEALFQEGKIEAEVIHINKFGSLHLNISHATFDELDTQKGKTIQLRWKGKTLRVPIVHTFGEVPRGKPLILKDDYGRIEVAMNMGNFAKKHKIEMGNKIMVVR